MARGQITVATTKGAGTTYSLEVERGGKRSDHSCDYKGRRDNIQSGGGEGWGRGQVMVVTAMGPRMTYLLKVERGGMRSDHSCDCKGTKDDVQTGDGQWWQDVISQLQL